MRAQLRRLHSPDVADLRVVQPRPDACFAFFVQAMIGPDVGPGEEAFSFVVSGPANQEPNGYHWEKARLHLRHYDYDLLLQAVRDRCDQAEGATWQDVAKLLTRYLDWEFEDYTPFAESQ